MAGFSRSREDTVSVCESTATPGDRLAAPSRCEPGWCGASSSVGQSSGLIIRRSSVQARPAPPAFVHEFA